MSLGLVVLFGSCSIAESETGDHGIISTGHVKFDWIGKVEVVCTYLDVEDSWRCYRAFFAELCNIYCYEKTCLWYELIDTLTFFIFM